MLLTGMRIIFGVGSGIEVLCLEFLEGKESKVRIGTRAGQHEILENRGEKFRQGSLPSQN